MKMSYGLRINTNPPARIWSGVGDLMVPADIVETAPAVYSGGGQLVTLPDFQNLINGIAERLDITVSGVSPETLRLAMNSSQDVQNAKVHFVRFEFDDDWQLEEVAYEAVFKADALTVANAVSANGRTRSIGLSIGSENVDRGRAPIAFWTDADQRRRSPDDSFFDHVAGISEGTSRRFGPKS